MALEASTLEIVASGGLAEDVNPRVLQLGSWLALENVQIDKGGAFRKRHGYSEEYAIVSPVGSDEFGYYNDFSACWHLGNVGNSLYQFVVQTAPNGQWAAPFVAVRNLFSQWNAKDDVPPFVVRRSVGLRSHREFNGGAVIDANTARYTVGCTYDDDPTFGGALRIVLRGVDTKTGAVLQDDVVIGSLSPIITYLYGFTMKVTMAGSYIVVAHPGAGGVTLTIFDTSTKTFGSVQIVASVAAGLAFPSIWSLGGNNVVVAYQDNATLWVREFAIISPTSASLIRSYSYVETNGIFELEVCTDDNDDTAGGASRVFVTYAINTGENAGMTKSLALVRSTFALAWGPIVLDGAQAWRTITNVWCAGELVSTGNDYPAGSADQAIIYVKQVHTTGAIYTSQLLTGGLTLAARPFVWQDRAYLPMVARAAGSGGPPLTGIIVELKSTRAAGFEVLEPAALVATFAVEEWGTYKFGGYFTQSRPTGYGPFCFAAPVFTGVAQTGLDVIEVHTPRDTWQLPTTVAQGLAVIPGGLTSYFDGQGIFEAGFIEPPLIIDIVGAGPPQLAAGTYLYVAVWEYYDAQGNVHYSQPCAPFSFTAAGGASADLTIATLRATRRSRDLDGQERKVRLVVYRTKVGSSRPFYRLTSPTVESVAAIGLYNGPNYNNAFTATMVFRDTTGDGDIDPRGYGLLPFDLAGNANGVLDCDPPPPSLHALNHKQRLWLVSGDNPRAVWYSRVFQNKEAPCFSRLLQFEISDTTEDITALAPLGDKVLIFTKSRIYFVSGDGPGNTGADGLPFDGPYLVSDSIGCTSAKSIAVFPGGVLFAQATGYFGDEPRDVSLYKIDASLQPPVRISAPVEDTLTEQSVFVGTWVDTSRGWVGWGVRRGYYDDEAQNNAVHLVWSYWTSTWFKWITPGMRACASALDKGLHVMGVSTFDATGAYAYEAGTVWRETPNTYTDPAPSMTAPVPAPQWITMRLQTPWVHPGALAGYARTRRIQVFGETGPTDESYLVVRTEHDHVEAVVGDYAFPIAPDSLRQYPLVRVEAVVPYQKANAIRITVLDAQKQPTEYGPGTTISAISLEIAGKKGLAKLAKSNRGRDTV